MAPARCSFPDFQAHSGGLEPALLIEPFEIRPFRPLMWRLAEADLLTPVPGRTGSAVERRPPHRRLSPPPKSNFRVGAKEPSCPNEKSFDEERRPFFAVRPNRLSQTRSMTAAKLAHLNPAAAVLGGGGVAA